MKIDVFEMERMQSTWENVVDFDLSESGVLPISLRELSKMGFDIEWVAGLGEGYSFISPEAGAMAFLKYPSPTPSLELVERIRDKQSTLIVPGIHLGLEGYLRLWLGGEQAYLEEGLRRVAKELS